MPSSSNLKCLPGSTNAELMTGFSMTSCRTFPPPETPAAVRLTPAATCYGVYRTWVTEGRRHLAWTGERDGLRAEVARLRECAATSDT